MYCRLEGLREPVIRIYYAKTGTVNMPCIYLVVPGRGSFRCHEVQIHGPSRVIDNGPDASTEKPRVWLETESHVSFRIGNKWEACESDQ